MEITIVAKFVGYQRLGYKTGFWYQIIVCGLSVECKADKLPSLAYSSIATFLNEWDSINLV